MRKKHSKSNESLEFLNRRLDEVRMSDIDRLKAKAQLARAEAIADFFAAMVHGVGRMLKTAGKPPRRPAASAG